MDLHEARDFFSNDIYATEQTDIKIIEIAQNYSKCELVISKIHMNADNKVMGGVYYTLADFCFAIATDAKTTKTVTTSSTITYLSACKGKELIAECKKIKEGRTLCTYETVIYDDLGTKVALIISNGMHTA